MTTPDLILGVETREGTVAWGRESMSTDQDGFGDRWSDKGSVGFEDPLDTLNMDPSEVHADFRVGTPRSFTSPHLTYSGRNEVAFLYVNYPLISYLV